MRYTEQTLAVALRTWIRLFKSAVIGVIMLSTFVYSGVLLMIIVCNKDQFRAEKNAENASPHAWKEFYLVLASRLALLFVSTRSRVRSRTPGNFSITFYVVVVLFAVACEWANGVFHK